MFTIMNSVRDYIATIIDGKKCVAHGEFFCKDNIEEAVVTECNDSNLFLVVGLDTEKMDVDSLDREVYADMVANMVKGLILK